MRREDLNGREERRADLRLVRCGEMAVDREPEHPPRILLLEDDPAMRELLRETLEEEGYEVLEDDSATPRIERMASGEVTDGAPEFDLLVTDIRMPGRTGLEILEGLRSYDFLMPVILITAYGSAEVHEEAERLGATLLDKPFEMEDLLIAVRELLPDPPEAPALRLAMGC